MLCVFHARSLRRMNPVLAVTLSMVEHAYSIFHINDNFVAEPSVKELIC
jgi:hypothetical protein